MPGFVSDSPLARELIRIGDEAIATENDAKLRAYFAHDYVFHGPGVDLSFDQLRAYFASLRTAFSELRIVREQIIVEGSFLAARTTFSGDFHRGLYLLAHRSAPRVGSRRYFRYHHDGRLAEEWVQTDYRSFLTKLGVSVAESV